MFRIALLLASVVSAVLGGPALRIHSGTDAALGEIPFQVSIQNRDGAHQCGGVVVGPFKVITSPSCVSKIVNINQAIVRTGTITLDGGVSHRVRSYTENPGYTINAENQGVPENDIAVILVDREIVYDGATGRAFMPPQDAATPVDANCTISGWGTLNFGGASPDVLKKANVIVMDDMDCSAEFGELLSVPVDNVICAENELTNADACDRDNGGPLFNDGIVWGLFSYGLGGRCGSAPGPGFYTKVSAFRSWIDSVN